MSPFNARKSVNLKRVVGRFTAFRLEKQWVKEGALVWSREGFWFCTICPKRMQELEGIASNEIKHVTVIQYVKSSCHKVLSGMTKVNLTQICKREHFLDKSWLSFWESELISSAALKKRKQVTYCQRIAAWYALSTDNVSTKPFLWKALSLVIFSSLNK